VIGQAIRARRFESRDAAEILLEFTDAAGAVQVYSVVNAALGGLLAAVELEAEALPAVPEAGQILAEARLRCNGDAHELGRLAVRRHEEHDGWLFLALSCVDARIPLYGALAKHFHAAEGDNDPFAMELGAQKFNLATFSDADYQCPDLFQKCRDAGLLFDSMLESGLYQYYGVRHAVDRGSIRLSLPHRPRPKHYINFASYDYLGLSGDPQVREATIKAVERFGVSATATPPNGGNSTYHEELEHTLARMLRKEAALVFNSGFAANVGCLAGILGRSDLAVADFYVHASIHDGLAAGKGTVKYFRHNDLYHLDRVLSDERTNYAGTLLLTEGLFSMDGDVPDLARYVEIARRHQCRTFIDEVHSFGIMGPGGLGCAERQGVLDDMDLYIGSLSKGIGAGGGFVAGSRDTIQYLRLFARMELFSSAISPCMAAAALKSLEIIREDKSRRKKLMENARHFREGLRELGYDAPVDPDSPIIPVIIRDPQKMAAMNQVLLDHKIFTNLIVFPAVAQDQCRFRFTITAGHSFSDIELALAALRAALRAAMKIEISSFSE